MVVGLSLLAATLPADTAFGQVNPFGKLGSEFTKEDSQLLRVTVRKLLASGALGAVSSWRNERSGNFGTMELEKALTIRSLPCKQVAHVIKLNRERDARLYRVTYCKVGEDWKVAP